MFLEKKISTKHSCLSDTKECLFFPNTYSVSYLSREFCQQRISWQEKGDQNLYETLKKEQLRDFT